MTASNHENAQLYNMRAMSQWRMNYENVALGAAGVKVLAVDSAPVQFVTLTGNATMRLPLAALDGTMFHIRATGAFTLTVTDDAGSPATIATLAAETAGWFMKRGAAYVCMGESAAIA